jgi:hypothetical protein
VHILYAGAPFPTTLQEDMEEHERRMEEDGAATENPDFYEDEDL